MTHQFTGKVVLVTGGGTGIGKATALAFAREGAHVVVAGRRSAPGEETVRQMREAGGEATFIPTDVTQDAAVKELIERTVALYGRLDAAFNNAGHEGQPGPLIEQEEDTFRETIHANLKSVWLSMKYEIVQMLTNGGGSIVNNASSLGLVGMAGMTLYTAAKHGVVGLTQAGALEYASQGIRINAIAPGPVWTPMAERFMGSADQFTQVMASLTAIGRVAQPEEMAQSVLWLCSDGASFVHGTTVSVDGGWTAR